MTAAPAFILLIMLALFLCCGVVFIALICRTVYSMGIPDKLDKAFKHKEPK